MHIFTRLIIIIGLLAVQTVPSANAEEVTKNTEEVTKKRFERTPGNALVMLLGDDLIASKGLAKSLNFAAQLKKRYINNGYHVDVMDNTKLKLTTEKLLEMLDNEVYIYNPDVVIIQIGLTDYREEVPVENIQYNLDLAIWKLRESNPKISVILVGDYFSSSTRTPEYNKSFNGMFKFIAGRYQIPFYPMFRNVVVSNPMHNIGGNIHPNAYGMKLVLDAMMPYLHPSISKASEDVYFAHRHRVDLEERLLAE